MNCFNPEVSELIEERKRKSSTHAKKINTLAQIQRGETKRRMEEVNYQKEIAGINNYEY